MAGSAAVLCCGWVRPSAHTLPSQASIPVTLLHCRLLCSACVDRAGERVALVQVLFGRPAAGRRQARGARRSRSGLAELYSFVCICTLLSQSLTSKLCEWQAARNLKEAGQRAEIHAPQVGCILPLAECCNMRSHKRALEARASACPKDKQQPGTA